MKRRAFLGSMAAAGATVFGGSSKRLFAKPNAPYFSVHSFIETHPEAVFIQVTNVGSTYAAWQANTAGRQQAGLNFARDVFVPSTTGGIPTSNKIAIKPNQTSSRCSEYDGIITDPYFLEGVINGMKELGIAANNFHVLEVNAVSQRDANGYNDMVSRTGVNFPDRSASFSWDYSVPDQVTLVNNPNGVMFAKHRYIAPLGQANTWALNIAKLKSHGMGLTLCAKNLQGTLCMKYCSLCETPTEMSNQLRTYDSAYQYNSSDFKTHFTNLITQKYDEHLAAGFSRWDRKSDGPGYDGAYRMEAWSQRTLDSLSVIQDMGLNVIEGILSQDGDGFCEGPNFGLPNRYASNLLIFGKNKFLVDLIGLYMGKHEPGNFGFYHIAKERGLLDSNCTLNPKDIPVYFWPGIAGVPTLITDQDTQLAPYRYDLLTSYIQKSGEDLYHLVNEPYTYPPSAINPIKREKPNAFILENSFPHPNNTNVDIEYRLPASGHVLIEIFDIHGSRVAVLAKGHHAMGAHMARWSTKKQAAGLYLLRFSANGISQSRKITLVR